MTADNLEIPDSTAELLDLPEAVRQEVEDALKDINQDQTDIANHPAVAKAFKIIEKAGLACPKEKLIKYVQNRLLDILS